MDENKIESGQQVIIPIPRQKYVIHLIRIKCKNKGVSWRKRKISWDNYVCNLIRHGDDGLYFASEDFAELRLEELKEIEEQTKAKSTAEKMAEFIMRSPIDFCKQCCADRKRCNESMDKLWKEHEEEKDYFPPMPPEKHCIANIIKYFEK